MIATITVNQGTRACSQGATRREEVVVSSAEGYSEARQLQQRLTAAGWMSGLPWLPCRNVVWKVSFVRGVRGSLRKCGQWLQWLGHNCAGNVVSGIREIRTAES